MQLGQVYANEGNAVIQHLSSLDDITASYSQVPSLAEPMEDLPSRPKAAEATTAASPAVPLPAGLEDDTEEMDQSERNIAGQTSLILSAMSLSLAGAAMEYKEV